MCEFVSISRVHTPIPSLSVILSNDRQSGSLQYGWNADLMGVIGAWLDTRTRLKIKAGFISFMSQSPDQAAVSHGRRGQWGRGQACWVCRCSRHWPSVGASVGIFRVRAWSSACNHRLDLGFNSHPKEQNVVHAHSYPVTLTWHWVNQGEPAQVLPAPRRYSVTKEKSEMFSPRGKTTQRLNPLRYWRLLIKLMFALFSFILHGSPTLFECGIIYSTSCIPVPWTGKSNYNENPL